MMKNETRGTTIATEVHLADSFLKRLRGLLFRTHLPAGHALVIDETNSIHMFFMLFSIDVIFTDDDGMVTAVFPHRRPFSFPIWSWKATHAVELPVGSIAASGTQPGDQLSW